MKLVKTVENIAFISAHVWPLLLVPGLILLFIGSAIDEPIINYLGWGFVIATVVSCSTFVYSLFKQVWYEEHFNEWKTPV